MNKYLPKTFSIFKKKKNGICYYHYHQYYTNIFYIHFSLLLLFEIKITFFKCYLKELLFLIFFSFLQQ